jgi:hypothetical protein
MKEVTRRQVSSTCRAATHHDIAAIGGKLCDDSLGQSDGLVRLQALRPLQPQRQLCLALLACGVLRVLLQRHHVTAQWGQFGRVSSVDVRAGTGERSRLARDELLQRDATRSHGARSTTQTTSHSAHRQHNQWGTLNAFESYEHEEARRSV